MEKKIYFDMDGTFYNLYGYENWLNCILSEKTDCYTKSDLLVDYDKFVSILLELKENGYTIGIITWLSKNATHNYENKVRSAKYRYLNKNFNGIFDEIHIVKYGTNKEKYCTDSNYILFDDEEPNRTKWNKKGIAYDVCNMLETLQEILEMS